MQLSEVRFAVPTAAAGNDLARVASIIGSFDVTGQAIDGARVGAPGWVFARTLGDAADETLLFFDAEQDATAFLLPWKTVHAALVEEFGGGVLVGTELDLGTGHKVHQDGLFALGGDHDAVALIADRKDPQLAALATGVERDLIAARIAGWIVVAAEHPATYERLLDDLSDGMYAVALVAGGKAPALVLWRRGEFTQVAMVRGGNVQQVLLWGPGWTTIEPVSLHRFGLQEFVDHVGEDLDLGHSDGSELIKHFKLSKDAAVHLRATARSPTYPSCSPSSACRRPWPRHSPETGGSATFHSPGRIRRPARRHSFSPSSPEAAPRRFPRTRPRHPGSGGGCGETDEAQKPRLGG